MIYMDNLYGLSNHCWLMDNLTGWWLTYPSEKYEFVSWDDDILNIWENNPVMFQENHQPESYINSYHIGFSGTETGPR